MFHMNLGSKTQTCAQWGLHSKGSTFMEESPQPLICFRGLQHRETQQPAYEEEAHASGGTMPSNRDV